jgi:putative membrane protein
MKLILRWIIGTFALFVAQWVVDGIVVEGDWMVYALVALILGLVNATVRPLLKLLSCPLIILTLGLFVLVINAGTLMLASVISRELGLGFYVTGFWPAFWGGLIVSVVSVLLSTGLKDD